MARRIGLRDRKQHTWLQGEAVRRGIPFSEMLRRVVDVAKDMMSSREMEGATRT